MWGEVKMNVSAFTSASANESLPRNLAAVSGRWTF